MNETIKNSVLVVDDERSNILTLTRILSREYTIYAAKNGLDAIEAANESLPDVILLDILMPEMDGYAVIAALKGSDRTRHIPVIFITGLDNPDDEEKGLSMGAADYISKPLSSVTVQLRVRNQIKILNYLRMIEQLSMTDQLTNLPNRRNFDERLRVEWNRAIRDKTSISILIIDLDDFKHYNDIYGHQQGDAALRALAKIFTCELKRSVDYVARWGGEEFVILLTNTDCNEALKIAEGLRISTENTPVLLTNGHTTKITISVGINTLMPTPNSSVDEFIHHADDALYTAKKRGRNKVWRIENT